MKTSISRPALSVECGFTLIELLSFILLMCAVIYGGLLGLKWGVSHERWIKALAGIVGAVLGGIGFYAALFLIFSPFMVYGAIKRALQPADLVCHCQPGDPTPKHLQPDKEIEIQALAESRRLAELPDYARFRETEPATEESLREQLTKNLDFAERIALAARLGNASALAIGIEPRKPLIRYKNWAKLPEDLRAVLRSGLPPRLCIVWAMVCVERVLPVFEREFHQDKRPRQAFGAALLAMRDRTPEAVELCRPPTLTLWRATEAGCRILHRDLWTRIRGRPSKGELAVKPILTLVRSAADFFEPRSLWATYAAGDIAHAYMTPEHRCAWTQPCFHAEDVTYEAALVSEEPEKEYQWQRAELARMILGWERWAEDRMEWQKRVEEEWIPKVLRELKGVRFNVPAYAKRIRKEFVPWAPS
jgi:hypothetical protein